MKKNIVKKENKNKKPLVVESMRQNTGPIYSIVWNIHSSQSNVMSKSVKTLETLNSKLKTILKIETLVTVETLNSKLNTILKILKEKWKTYTQNLPANGEENSDREVIVTPGQLFRKS